MVWDNHHRLAQSSLGHRLFGITCALGIFAGNALLYARRYRCKDIRFTGNACRGALLSAVDVTSRKAIKGSAIDAWPTRHVCHLGYGWLLSKQLISPIQKTVAQ